MLTLCIAFISCNANAGKPEKKTQDSEKKDCVEVLYFHGKQRCATCVAIEENTKAAVESEFADELKNGEVVFRIIDITKEENEKIADKYEVTWSSLFIVNHRNGKEKAKNMTEFAFGNARKSPDKFKAGVIETVNGMLK